MNARLLSFFGMFVLAGSNLMAGPCLNVACSTNKVVECSSAWDFDTPTVLGNCCGSNETITVLSTTTNGFCPQMLTRTWAITNGCGDSIICSQTVTVADTTPPVMSCASNKTVICGSNWSFDPPVATDSCCGSNLIVTIVDTETNGDCPQLITRTWQAVDCCGNTNMCDQVVTVTETNGPVVMCSSIKTVQFGTTWSFDPPVVSDCSTVTTSILSTVTNGYYQITFNGGGSAAHGEIYVVDGAAVSGTLDVTAGDKMGRYTLLPGSGSIDAFFWWDNLVYPDSNPFVNWDGLMFTSDGTLNGYKINLYGLGLGNYGFAGGSTEDQPFDPDVNGVATIAAEPPQWVTRTWVFANACGYSNTCSQTVSVLNLVALNITNEVDFGSSNNVVMTWNTNSLPAYAATHIILQGSSGLAFDPTNSIWHDIYTNPSSPVTVTATNQQQFFRLKITF